MRSFVVILAGGAGTRFWPAGRRARPKQLLRIASDQTMLRDTLQRCEPLAPPENTFIITNEAQREATRKESPELPTENVVAEPKMRNTAAAIGLAALLVEQRDPEGVMTILSADHVIRPVEKFVDTFQAAARRAAEADVLITIGIQPTGPATGYGYIEAGERVAEIDGHAFHCVASFKEKPDAATAGAFLQAGGYLWNAGTFVWRVSTIRKAFAEHLPGHHALLEELKDRIAKEPPPAHLYERFDNVPIDIGVIERADNVEVTPADFEWDDVGSWLAVGRLHSPNEQANVVLGDHVGVDTGNCIIVSPDHLVATIGLENMIVVHTPDATLIAPKDRAEEVKRMVARLEEQGRGELL